MKNHAADPHSSMDRRTTPFRDDLAAEQLRGQVVAPRFVSPVRQRVCAPQVPLRRKPDPDFAYDSELLFGEDFDVYDQQDGWAWGQASADRYVGYLPANALTENVRAKTHRIASLRTFVYPEAHIKATPRSVLSYGAQVSVLRMQNRFAELPEGYVFSDHLAAIDSPVADPVAEAERFLGIPYLWGGKTSLGLDCSGLVQLTCQAAGIAAPRDSDMQERSVGLDKAVPSDPAGFARGDLLFWAGHVAIAQGEGRMIHATAWSMSVISEDIGPAITRIAGQGHPLRTVRQLPKP